MRVPELLMGRKGARRMRRAIPKTMDAIQSRVERVGSDVAERLRGVGSRIRSADWSAARKAVRRGGERTAKWVRDNPRAMPLIGLGGALAAVMMMLRARRNARRRPKLGRLLASVPLLRKGMGSMLGRVVGWALTPRKPRIFRAVMIKW